MSAEGSDSREGRAQVRTMLLIGAIASAVGIALALAIDWFPTQASVQGEKIDTLWDVLLIASVPVFVLVETIVLYCAIKFRMRPGEELKDGPPIHGNTRLEIIWTAIPAILLVGLCTYAYVTLTDIEKAQANAMNVRVVGEQFTWTFHYRGEDGKEISSNQLYLPENTPVYFTVQSKDVIHDFWVPAFRHEDRRRARDRHPPAGHDQGRAGQLPGRLRGAVRARALDDAPDRARAEPVGLRRAADQAGGRAQAGAAAGGGEETDGKTLFTEAAQPACSSCHTLADAGATGTTGPDLDKVLPDLSAAEIKESIQDPNAKITPGFPADIMPRYGDTLSEKQVDALVKYLKEVAGG